MTRPPQTTPLQTAPAHRMVKRNRAPLACERCGAHSLPVLVESGERSRIAAMLVSGLWPAVLGSTASVRGSAEQAEARACDCRLDASELPVRPTFLRRCSRKAADCAPSP